MKPIPRTPNERVQALPDIFESNKFVDFVGKGSLCFLLGEEIYSSPRVPARTAGAGPTTSFIAGC
jgi:hypothetical protein